MTDSSDPTPADRRQRPRSGQPLRIANFSGYYGDRQSAIDEAMAGDPVDVLVGDYLAEITLASLAAAHHRDPSVGYVKYVVDQLRPHWATIAARGMKVVTNAGGFNPRGLAEKLREEIREAGSTLTVAHVEGDNVVDRLDALEADGHALTNLDDGRALADWGVRPFAANAYLGGWGIAAALAHGADIVVCGRVTDASLTVGPAAWWHGWDEQSWDQLAGAVVAGHVIECGPQAVGGNFSGFLDVPSMALPGFPIAQIEQDGSCVIAKRGRDGGAVTVDAVTAQLVYEVQGPLYANPDVTVDLSDVRLETAGPDRVRVHGAVEERALAALARGVTVEGVRYGPIEAGLDSRRGANAWLTVALQEGKNREIRRVMAHLDLGVTRLIRTAYGPFQLGALPPGAVEEVSPKVLREQLGLAAAPRPARNRGGARQEPDQDPDAG